MRYLIHFVAVFIFCLSMSVAEAQNKVVVIPLGSSGVKAVNDSSACDAAKAGTIRWTGSDFEGCNGMAWIIFSMSFGTVTSAGEVWMDRNLGASRVATSMTDTEAYGGLYQWGRPTDGHELRTSPATTTLSTTDVPGHSRFILAPFYPGDWRTPQNAELWQGVSGINNPCPAGFRLPTAEEWEMERGSWSSQNSTGAFASPLKLVEAGWRSYLDGAISAGGTGAYCSSTVDSTGSIQLNFNNIQTIIWSRPRAYGFSVRCIKD